MSNKPLSTYTVSPRRLRNHERMIQTILETARLIMRENGVASLSMQELARRLDMRAPSLYHYFSSKMDIYDALFRLGYTLFDEYLDKTVQKELPWQEELRRIFEAYMTFAMQNPELYQLCFERPVPGFVPSEESTKISFGMLEKYYQRSAELKVVMENPLSAEQTADLLIAIMHGLTALHLANEPHLPVGEGRFGALIPAALSVLDKAWSKH
jgi:AcrR family transcriptional regulator